MVKLRTFRNALKKAESISIRKIPDTEIKTAKKAVYDMKTKTFKFYDEDDNIIFKFHKNDIDFISRILTDNADDKYKFLISLKDDEYEMEFIMEEGFTFFVSNESKRRSIEWLIKSAPKYLSRFKDKSVIVKRTSYNPAFSIYDLDHGTEVSVVTESLCIQRFDYEVQKLSGLAVINFVDKANGNIFSKAMDAMTICGTTGDGIMIGCRSGNYSLELAENY